MGRTTGWCRNVAGESSQLFVDIGECVEHIGAIIDRVVMTTQWRSPSPCETHRCVKNVAGESPWLRGDIYRCAEHGRGGTGW